MADADYLNFTVSLVYFAATSEEQKHIGQATEGRQGDIVQAVEGRQADIGQAVEGRQGDIGQAMAAEGGNEHGRLEHLGRRGVFCTIR